MRLWNCEALSVWATPTPLDAHQLAAGDFARGAACTRSRFSWGSDLSQCARATHYVHRRTTGPAPARSIYHWVHKIDPSRGAAVSHAPARAPRAHLLRLFLTRSRASEVPAEIPDLKTLAVWGAHHSATYADRLPQADIPVVGCEAISHLPSSAASFAAAAFKALFATAPPVEGQLTDMPTNPAAPEHLPRVGADI
jgi:hypothetical protein